MVADVLASTPGIHDRRLTGPDGPDGPAPLLRQLSAPTPGHCQFDQPWRTYPASPTPTLHELRTGARHAGRLTDGGGAYIRRHILSLREAEQPQVLAG